MGPKDDINMLLRRPNIRRMPEIMLCRILMLYTIYYIPYAMDSVPYFHILYIYIYVNYIYIYIDIV